MSVTKLAMLMALFGLAACGETVEQRAASGAIGGAAVGTAVGGPLAGAAVGGTVGALSR
jgi:osmotically inducible lipoprotein OsmB